MSRIGEKVAYLKGLAEGLGVNAETEQGRLMLAMIDTMEALAGKCEETDERVSELSEYVEEIDATSAIWRRFSSLKTKTTTRTKKRMMMTTMMRTATD